MESSRLTGNGGKTQKEDDSDDLSEAGEEYTVVGV